MDPVSAWLIGIAVAYAFKRYRASSSAEASHRAGLYEAEIGGTHPDWSPSRVQRHARARARSHWWGQAAQGFPGFWGALREDWESAQAVREETKLRSWKHRKDLRDRIEAARRERERLQEEDWAARRAGADPETEGPAADPAPDPDPAPAPAPAPEPQPETEPTRRPADDPDIIDAEIVDPEPAATPDAQPGPQTPSGDAREPETAPGQGAGPDPRQDDPRPAPATAPPQPETTPPSGMTGPERSGSSVPPRSEPQPARCGWCSRRVDAADLTRMPIPASADERDLCPTCRAIAEGTDQTPSTTPAAAATQINAPADTPSTDEGDTMPPRSPGHVVPRNGTAPAPRNGSAVANGGAGEAWTHGQFENSAASVQAHADAVPPKLESMLSKLRSVDAGRSQVRGVIHAYELIGAFIGETQQMLTESNRRARPVVRAVDNAGGPEEIANMPYYQRV